MINRLSSRSGSSNRFRGKKRPQSLLVGKCVVTNGLQLFLDAGDVDSYPTTGTSVVNLSGGVNSVMTNGVGFSSSNNGVFTFDGSNDYIDTNRSFASESFTLSAWIKCDDVTGYRMIFSKEQTGGWPWNYRLFLNQTNGHLVADIAQSASQYQTITYSTNLADNNWHNVVFIRSVSDDKLYLYVDGSLVSTLTDAFVGSVQNSQEVWIGRSAYAGAYNYKGSISNVLIYNRDLSSSEITQNYNCHLSRFIPPTSTPTPTPTATPTATPTPTSTPTPTPTSTPTPTPTIISFNNPTLTIGSAVTTVSQSPFAGGGNSYSFSSSTSSYITIPGSNDWAVGTDDFTIEWFSYQTSLSQFQRAFTVGDYPNIKIGVSIESGTFYYWANNSFRYSSSSASTTNTWIHWAVVRQSGITKVYKNGTLLGSQISDTNNVVDNTTSLVIGNTNTFATNSALVGYLTNFRWVKGLAVYTGNFTKPTSTLTATASANPYGGSNTQAIGSGYTKLLLVP